MTNAEMFTTASERKIAYSQYCDDCAKNDKAVFSNFDWLDAEYVPPPKPYPILLRRFVRNIQRRNIQRNMAVAKCLTR